MYHRYVNTETLKQFGKIIKSLREQRGFSQENVAEHLQIARQAVSQIEQGKRSVDSLELVKLAEFFSVSTDLLLQPIIDSGTTEFSRDLATHDAQDIVFDEHKFEALLLYILKQCGGKPNVGETVLYKLLYFCDFNAYEILGHSLSGMRYVKLQFGPVPKQDDYLRIIRQMTERNELKIFSHSYHGKLQKRYISLVDSATDCFSEKERDVIDSVIGTLSGMNASLIADYAHGDVPWAATEVSAVIDYNLVFERTVPYAHHNYRTAWQDASGHDILRELGEPSKEETVYYNNL